MFIYIANYYGICLNREIYLIREYINIRLKQKKMKRYQQRSPENKISCIFSIQDNSKW